MQEYLFYIDDTIPQIEIRYSSKLSASQRYKVVAPKGIIEKVYELWDKDTIGAFEEFKVVLLDSSNVVKGIYSHSKGGIDGTVVDITLLLAVALKSLSKSLLLVHNHPSYTLIPSKADIAITEKIKSACELLDIRVLDHFILAPDGTFYSFSEKGKL